MDRVTVDPELCGGRPCIRVIDVLEFLAAGLSREQVLAELPGLEADDVTVALRYASRRLDHPVRDA